MLAQAEAAGCFIVLARGRPGKKRSSGAARVTWREEEYVEGCGPSENWEKKGGNVDLVDLVGGGWGPTSRFWAMWLVGPAHESGGKDATTASMLIGKLYVTGWTLDRGFGCAIADQGIMTLIYQLFRTN